MGSDQACVQGAGPNPQSDAVLISDSGGLQNVYVHVLTGLDPEYGFDVPTSPAVLDQKGCVYSPRVIGVRAGQPIEIALAATDHRVTIAVRDHGIGIAPDDHERIFKRFERAVSSQNYGGLGLGLWIVREIVTEHGGEIRLDSAPGRGTVMEIELPRGST